MGCLFERGASEGEYFLMLAKTEKVWRLRRYNSIFVVLLQPIVPNSFMFFCLIYVMYVNDELMNTSLKVLSSLIYRPPNMNLIAQLTPTNKQHLNYKIFTMTNDIGSRSFKPKTYIWDCTEWNCKTNTRKGTYRTYVPPSHQVQYGNWEKSLTATLQNLQVGRPVKSHRYREANFLF